MNLKGLKNGVVRWVKKPLHGTGLGQFLWGTCAALGMPPTSLLPCFLGAFLMHRYVLRDVCDLKTSFLKGWWFHLGFMTTSLHWIVTALSVDWAQFWWLAPGACLGLPALLALFGGIAAAGASQIRGQGFLALWLQCLSYWGMEWARGHLLTGFPWHLYGYALTGFSVLEQSASLFGVYGLSFCVLLVALLGFMGITQRASPLTPKIALSLAGSIPLGLLIYGASHLAFEHYEENQEPPFHIRLVQPNIPQTLKQSGDNASGHLKTLMHLSMLPAHHPLDAIIWPETALPYAIPAHNLHVPFLPLLKPWTRFLITGAVEKEGNTASQEPFYYNSLLVLDAQNVIQARYRKKHLVPFGEFIPGRHWIPLPSVASGYADYHAGPGPITLSHLEWPAFGPLICYDVIFSHEVASYENAQPHWLVNITNDAWFAHGWGPQQHLHLARIRAIEEGLPLVRVANTGISAVVDAYGRIVRALPFQTQGIIDEVLPAPLKGTWFRLYGHYSILLMIGMLGIVMGCLDQIIKPWTRLSRHHRLAY